MYIFGDMFLVSIVTNTRSLLTRQRSERRSVFPLHYQFPLERVSLDAGISVVFRIETRHNSRDLLLD